MGSKMSIPFNKNEADQIHCLQACLKSILEYFEPDGDWGFDKLDKLTGFREGMLTWPMKGHLEIAKMGYDTVVFDSMDFAYFAARPHECMVELYGEASADLYQKKSDIPQAVIDARNLVEQSNADLRTDLPNRQNLEALLEDGYLCICHVDQAIIRGSEDQGDHFILVFDADQSGVTAHNPGPPPEADQKLSWKIFETAWASPTDGSKTIWAIKPKNA